MLASGPLKYQRHDVDCDTRQGSHVRHRDRVVSVYRSTQGDCPQRSGSTQPGCLAHDLNSTGRSLAREVLQLLFYMTPVFYEASGAQEGSHANIQDRFGFKADLSLEQNMAAYLNLFQTVGASCVLRASCVEGLLSRWGVRGAVFTTRRPAEAYWSYGQPSRHADMIDTLDGLESPEAAEFFAASWRAVASEYFACLHAGLQPVLIRYERAREDARGCGDPVLEAMFDQFRPATGPIAVPMTVRARMETLSGPDLLLLYP